MPRTGWPFWAKNRAFSPVPQPASRTSPVTRSAASTNASCGLPMSQGGLAGVHRLEGLTIRDVAHGDPPPGLTIDDRVFYTGGPVAGCPPARRRVFGAMMTFRLSH